MVVWAFTILAWLLLLAGVFVAWRFGWRDPGKGTRRCPRCWYDMSATSGLKCPECGRESASERDLYRSRSRKRWLFVGVLIAASSYPAWRGPLLAKHGPIAIVPRAIVLSLLPEISARWGPSRLPVWSRAAMLISGLGSKSPLNLVERRCLAFGLRRWLLDDARRSEAIDVLQGLSTEIEGQVGNLADGLAACVDDPTALKYPSFLFKLPLEADPRLRSLGTKVARAIESGKLQYNVPELVLEQLRVWGASREQLRSVGRTIVLANKADAWRVLSFLWQHRLLDSGDEEAVLRWASWREQSVEGAIALCATDLPEARSAMLTFLAQWLDRPTSAVAFCSWAMLAAGSRESADTLLPVLDRFAATSEDPTIDAAARIAAASLRGHGDEALALWTAAMRRGENYDAHLPQPWALWRLVLTIDISEHARAEALALAIEQSAKMVTPTGYMLDLEDQLRAVGRLGSAGAAANGPILSLVRSNAPLPLIEHALQALTAIGRLTVEQRRELEERFAESQTAAYRTPNTRFYYRTLIRTLDHASPIVAP